MAELDIGQPAPPFELPGNGDTTLRLSDFRGKIVVLFFYPQDGTSTCTAEATSFSAASAKFARAGAVLIGISPDAPARHDRFVARHRLKLRLASDEGHETIRAYGSWGPKVLFGRAYDGVVRSTFLIDRDGIIRRIWRKVKVNGHAEEVLAEVKAITAKAE